ncbi:MAG: hypothetical protein ACE5DX_03930 [Candidatus Dojkabacteria bacterium]
MKQLLATCAVLFILVSQPLVVNAQSEQGDSGITLSPAIVTVGENEVGSSFELTVTNNTEKRVVLAPELIHFRRTDEGKTEIIDDYNGDNFLEFSTDRIALKPKESKILDVRVKLVIDSVTAFPGVKFTPISKEEEVAFTTEVATVFLIQDFDGELAVNTDLALSQGIIAVSPDLSITGTILNNGDKFFNPSGTVTVSKDGQTLLEKQITTQIEGLLFPGESAQFETLWSNELSFTESIGTYIVETRVEPSPFTQTFVSRISIFYLPQEIFLLVVPLVIIVGGIFLALRYRSSSVTAPKDSQET